MGLFKTDHLNILFPQWQGSGYSNALYHGAREIEQFLKDINFKKIDVPENQDLAVENKILGYKPILSQLKAAIGIISDKRPATIFIAGGDCSVELAPVSYLNKRYNNLTLIWFDAHGDLNTPSSSPSKHFHGMPLRALLGQNDPQINSHCFSTLKPDQVILAGAREFDAPEQEFIQKQSIPIVSVDALENRPEFLADTIMEKGGQNIYIHIDLDVLDPVSYTNIKHPTPNGLCIETLYAVIQDLKEKFNVAGLGIVEFVAKNNTGLNEIKSILDILK